eukprot:15022666-Alexandrium_andersonii.AAC.1
MREHDRHSGRNSAYKIPRLPYGLIGAGGATTGWHSLNGVLIWGLPCGSSRTLHCVIALRTSSAAFIVSDPRRRV